MFLAPQNVQTYFETQLAFNSNDALWPWAPYAYYALGYKYSCGLILLYSSVKEWPGGLWYKRVTRIVWFSFFALLCVSVSHALVFVTSLK